MNLGIKDKKALITAASKGPGRACAISLAREGADRYSGAIQRCALLIDGGGYSGTLIKYQ